MSRLFVLDALGLAYRAHYAFIARPLVNSRGENTSALFGLANTALKIRREMSPDFWALAWDGPGPTFRHTRYREYKATRKPMPDDLRAQMPAIEDLASALGLPVLEFPGAEADDVMGTLARRGAADALEVALVTSDKDMLQLVGDRIRVLSPQGRGEDYTWVDAQAVKAKWGVPPGELRDLLALMGDTSDNVPGVPGVGEKTALELIQEFHSIDEIYARLPEVKKEAIRKRLEENREKAYLSRELVTVKTDLEGLPDWEALRCGPIRRDALLAIARRWELVRLERIAEQSGVSEQEAGAPPPRRSAERRGTAAETEAEGVMLLGRPSVPPPAPETSLDLESGLDLDAGPVPDPIDETRPEPASVDPAIAAPSPAPSLFTPLPALGAPAPPVAPRLEVQGTLDLWSSPGATTGFDLDQMTERLHGVRARALHGLALLPVASGEDPRTAELVGLALAARDGTTAYLPLAHHLGPNFARDRVREWLAPALGDPAVTRVAGNLKSALHLLSDLGLSPGGAGFDVGVGSFLCDPTRDHSLEALAKDWLAVALPPLESPAARGRPRAPLASLPVEELAGAAEAAAATLFPLAEAMRAQLESREQWPLYARLEHPLVAVLFDMEREGVLIDRRALEQMAERAGEEITRLEEELYALAGERLNLNSGPQLSKFLFETLKLKAGRRTAGGALSTDQGTLEELASEHPFPAKLLEYRGLAKLKSTYLDALPLVADARDGRVHTTFNQAGAATGRLSSSNPNLQNIPIRDPRGREIRRAFVAPEGWVLVGADYSQIELRVMAHLSGDPGLIEAFERDEDIHASTARRIFRIEGEIDPRLRARAKIVNFGIMYGMGARSLAQQMEIPLAEAQAFISDYFRVYARVREYLDSTVDEARRRGFVQTLMGRRRYLPELSDPGGARRAMGERVAINTPIQGSAADLMKLAMIRVHRALKGFGASARLLLQVHDELLIECRREEADAVSQVVLREMEGCFPLRVPLRASLGRGPTWFDVH